MLDFKSLLKAEEEGAENGESSEKKNGNGEPEQSDQKKIAKCLEKLPKNDFSIKIEYFDTFPKIA